MARQPPGGWLPGIDSEISPRRNRAYSPTARFMECVAFRTHPFQAQVSSVEQPWVEPGRRGPSHRPGIPDRPEEERPGAQIYLPRHSGGEDRRLDRLEEGLVR